MQMNVLAILLQVDVKGASIRMKEVNEVVFWVKKGFFVHVSACSRSDGLIRRIHGYGYGRDPKRTSLVHDFALFVIVLVSESTEGLNDKLENWREALEANGLRALLASSLLVLCLFFSFLFGFCMLDSDRLERWASFRLGGSMEGFEGLVGFGLPLIALVFSGLWLFLVFPFLYRALFQELCAALFCLPVCCCSLLVGPSALCKIACPALVFFIFFVPLCAFALLLSVCYVCYRVVCSVSWLLPASVFVYACSELFVPCVVAFAFYLS
ncbi:hypothetical protein Tco_0632711, partial [Tanacetum coccineum]